MTRTPPEDRPSARELAARSNGGSWECPKCSCKDLRGENSHIESTRHPGGEFVRRKRVCRHCGQGALVTQEVPVPSGFRVLIVPEDDVQAVA